MNKNEIKSNLTKKKLCDTYMNLYKKKNIEQITIREITEISGYNRGTFYIYYKDVYDIHEKIKKGLVLKAKDKFLNISLNKDKTPIEQLFEAIMEFYNENENQIIPLVTKDPTFSKTIKELLKPVLSKVLKIDLNSQRSEYLIEYHLSAVFGVLNYWINEKKNISTNDLFALIKEVSTKGVLTVITEK